MYHTNWMHARIIFFSFDQIKGSKEYTMGFIWYRYTEKHKIIIYSTLKIATFQVTLEAF